MQHACPGAPSQPVLARVARGGVAGDSITSLLSLGMLGAQAAGAGGRSFVRPLLLAPADFGLNPDKKNARIVSDSGFRETQSEATEAAAGMAESSLCSPAFILSGNHGLVQSSF